MGGSFVQITERVSLGLYQVCRPDLCIWGELSAEYAAVKQSFCGDTQILSDDGEHSMLIP